MTMTVMTVARRGLRMLCNPAKPIRRFLSAEQTAVTDDARRAANKSYLEAWVGNNRTTNATSIGGPASLLNSSLQSNPLFVSGSSYLLPTLRIERSDTPNSVASQLEQANRLRQADSYTNVKFKTPIVLDLRGWSPDGSHHYRPPQKGSIKTLVNLLDEHGLWVVGLTNCTLPPTCEEEVELELALPKLWPKPSSSHSINNNRISLEQILSTMMVLQNEVSMEPPPRIEEGYAGSEPEGVSQQPPIPSNSVLSRMKNSQLQEVLEAAQLSTTGTKQTLLDRINQGIDEGAITGEQFSNWYR